MPWRTAILLAAILAVPPAFAAAEDAPVPRPADPVELARVIAESRVETSAAPPGLTLYGRDAGAAMSRWLAGFLDRHLPGFGRLAGWFLGIVPTVLWSLLALLVGILLARLVRRGWRDRPPPRDRSPMRTLLAADGADDPARGAAWWEGELRRRLAGDELGAALVALWWWLARTLVAGPVSAGAAAPADVERSWTSRDLIFRAGRPDLRPLVERLDRLIYGPDAPTAEDLRRMFGDLREAVG